MPESVPRKRLEEPVHTEVREEDFCSQPADMAHQ